MTTGITTATAAPLERESGRREKTKWDNGKKMQRVALRVGSWHKEIPSSHLMRCGIRSIDERHLRAVEMESDDDVEEEEVAVGFQGYGVSGGSEVRAFDI